jgi:ADP-heptose:LPS heptosyltransferase
MQKSGTQTPFLQRTRIERVAVFRALRLGDMLCAVPALRSLRMALPQAKITLVGLPWAAQFAERFERYIDDFVAFPGHPAFPEQTTRETALPGFYADMCNRGFNLALQLHGNGKISNSIVRQFGARVLAGLAIPGASAETNEVLVNYPQCGAEPARLLHLIAHLGAPADHTNLANFRSLPTMSLNCSDPACRPTACRATISVFIPARAPSANAGRHSVLPKSRMRCRAASA